MVYMILGKGFEELEAIAPLDILRRSGVPVATAGIGGRTVEGAHGIPVVADCTVEDIDRDKLEMIVLPGGLGGVASIQGCPAAMDAIRQAHGDGKYVAAICAGPTVLAKLGITEGRTVTSYPGTEGQMGACDYRDDRDVVVDGKLITSRGPGTAVAFGLALARILAGEGAAQETAVGMLLR